MLGCDHLVRDAERIDPAESRATVRRREQIPPLPGDRQTRGGTPQEFACFDRVHIGWLITTLKQHIQKMLFRIFRHCAILMVMNQSRTPRLKPLLDALPPGFVVDTAWLKARGIDAKSIHDYAVRGWIERVVRGVYRRPLPNGARPDKLPWQLVLLSLQRLKGCDVHLGGESALHFAGHVHYLSLVGTRHVHLYGDAPSWLKRLPTTEQIVSHPSTLFGGDPVGVDDTDALDDESGWAVDIWRWPIKVSCPERAILEAIDELPDNASFEHLDRIFEGLVGLRPGWLMTLLAACRSIKVRRLFFVFADRHEHGWRKHLETELINFGSGPRALVQGGRFHPVYRVSLPEFLVPAEPVAAGDDV